MQIFSLAVFVNPSGLSLTMAKLCNRNEQSILKEILMYQEHELEGGLVLQSSAPIIAPVSQLYIYSRFNDARLKQFQVYFIMRRPRICVIPETVCYKNSLLRAKLIVQRGARFEEIDFKGILPPFHMEGFPSDWEPARVWADPGFPSSTIYVEPDFLPGGQLSIMLSDVLLYNTIGRPDVEDFHVDYIGHALGKDGLKGSIDRLVGRSGKRAGHENLQRILVELNSRHPDQEAFVALFRFEEQQRIMSGGATPHEPRNSFDDSPDRLSRFLDAGVPRSIRIKLAEAALIRYFQPRFNHTYKDAFPAAHHRIMKAIRSLDMTGVVATFHTVLAGVRMYSEVAAPSQSHIAFMPVRSEADRLSIFELL